MKKISYIFFVISIIVIIRFFLQFSSTKKEIIQISPTGTIQEEEKIVRNITKLSKTIFVPYWNSSVSDEYINTYDSYIYFGVQVDEQGDIIQDQAFKSIDKFLNSTDAKPQYLTLRMLDTNTNISILEKPEVQQKIISHIVELAQEKKFEGVVLDLELSALPLEDIKKAINLFVSDFSRASHKKNISFYMTIYGDTYYRGRPYDIATIGEYVDGILIMAYDFHKSRGEPGPNFPLTNKEVYGYDYERMIDDFSRDIEREKITVLFGMYGYDWILGPQGKPLKGATALPLYQIDNMLQPTCSLKNCDIYRDPQSFENKIIYKDDDGYTHHIWYEDELSVDKKMEYLKTEGIDKVGYWVYGYF